MSKKPLKCRIVPMDSFKQQGSEKEVKSKGASVHNVQT